MKVEIEQSSGFCFGVKRAIELAEQELIKDEKLYCLGDIVHNGKEIERLNSLGLLTIDKEKYKTIKNDKVLLRAHGEPPNTYLHAQAQNIELIDGTCPIVLRLQKKIKEAYANNTEQNQIVIFGKASHPEVISLCGQTNQQALVVREMAELEKLDPAKNTYLFSQTTMDTKEYEQISDAIKSKLNNGIQLHLSNSICGSVSGREAKLRAFARKHPVVVFVGGKKSSNGKMLFAICKSENPNSFFVSTTNEIDSTWFSDCKSVGVCGATSTPQWLLEEVANTIAKG